MSDDTLQPVQQVLDRHLVFSQPGQHLRVWVASPRSTLPPSPLPRLFSSPFLSSDCSVSSFLP